ncbi:MAG: low molecular weight phosphotyrosine protein phosphatase [Ruminococcus sp.]|uniref:low molecular weight protein-tyrosine-phosphatase n=1 Tax=Ruminococcus sp. TaxID=41978 RepID=UPI0025EFD859|nr:low molecular weight protein-tyrosine-phosphatase [Ruminococcus sp.]MCR5540378.1 low molecular weight phosphotyrosine protein phosphatase [Ruminococcus sp.]
MIKIMFVCHGNICRSAMSEFIMKDMIANRGLEDKIQVASSATSREEIGNDMYPPAKRKLDKEHIPYTRHHARQITKSDYAEYDLILCMEQYNIRNLKRIIPADPDNKIHLLLDYSDNPRDISDPWYSGDFDKTFDDIIEGCECLLEYLCRENII